MSATTNGNGRGGIIGTLASLAGSLPGQFLALVILNVIFLGLVLLFLNRVIDRAIASRQEQDNREQSMQEQVIGPLLNSCIAGLAKSAPAGPQAVMPVMPLAPTR